MNLVVDQPWAGEEVGIKHLAFDAEQKILLKTTHGGRAWIEMPDGSSFSIPTNQYKDSKSVLLIHDAKLSPNGNLAALTVASHVILVNVATQNVIFEARVSASLGFILSRGQALLLDNDQLLVSLDTGRIVAWGPELYRKFTPVDNDAPLKLARQPGSKYFWGSDGLHISRHCWETGEKLDSHTMGYRIYDIAVGGNRLVVRGGVGISWFDLDKDNPFNISTDTEARIDPWYETDPEIPSNSIQISSANPRISVNSKGSKVVLVSQKKVIVADLTSSTTKEYEGTEFLTYAAFYGEDQVIYGTREGAVRIFKPS